MVLYKISIEFILIKMPERKQFKYEQLIKLLVILGGIVGLLFQIAALFGYYLFLPSLFHGYFPFFYILIIVGMVISVLTILCGMRKEGKNGEELIPFTWIAFLVLGILLIVFGGGIIAFILLFIAFLLALIEEF